MVACDVGHMSLFVCSILWDLNVPQEAATIAYEDNNSCTAMGNTQKPTARTHHIDIKYFTLCKWVERNLIQPPHQISLMNPLSQARRLSHWTCPT
jgi:hypothetical protein